MTVWTRCLVACGAIFCAAAAHAESAIKIYQATEIVTGSDTRYRALGLGRDLRDVLVKASGDPSLADDPRLAALMPNAETYLGYYLYRDRFEGFHHHDDQGTYDRPFDLTAQFDPAKINALLAQLGSAPWSAKRPTLVPFIAVKGEDPPYRLDQMLTVDMATDNAVIADQRQSLETLTEKYGLFLRIPTDADVAAWGPDGGGAARLGADMALVSGSLVFRQADGGWLGDWRLRWRGVEHRWSVKGGSFDAAYDNLVAGAVRILSSDRAAPLKY